MDPLAENERVSRPVSVCTHFSIYMSVRRLILCESPNVVFGEMFCVGEFLDVAYGDRYIYIYICVYLFICANAYSWDMMVRLD